MPKSLSAKDPLNIRLVNLNCVVSYATQVENERHAPTGKQKIGKIVKDEEGKAVDLPKQIRAYLIPKGGDGKPWVSALGSDKRLALEAVLDLAEKTDRPMLSSAALTKENQELRSQIAEADRKAEKARQELAAHMGAGKA